MKSFLTDWLFAPRLAKLLVRILRFFRPKRMETSSRAKDFELVLNVVLSEGWDDFRQLAVDSKRYAEYGSGESTLFVARFSGASIRSVETDQRWVDLVQAKLPRQGEVLRVDLGSIGRWGRPDTYSRADNFMTYISAPFSSGYSPDLVLIDGRFRVACFLQTILSTSPGTKIVFDDYVTRPFYHLAESLIPPDKIGSRQALFTRPEKVDDEKLVYFLGKFEYVMD